ncbi:hypothetical protein [Mariniphaga sp.]
MKEQKKDVRDYSLIGVETQKAIEMGLAEAEWWGRFLFGDTVSQSV